MESRSPNPAGLAGPGTEPSLRIRLLGGVDATVDATAGGPDEPPIDIGPAKCQTLLAALALSAGTAVPVTRLVELVWGDDPPRTAEKTLQSYATRLRKGLGADRVVRTGSAYRLDVDPESIDAIRFERRLGAGDIEGALVEWGGPPLAGLDPGGLAGTVNGLVERWLGAVETDLERAVETDPAAAIGRLTELTSAHPFREGLWALLMTALYATGRQAEALAAYRRSRTNLVEAVGVEPGPRLRDLEARILNHDGGLSHRPPPDRAARSPEGIPSGTVTFAFCDVDGSARLWAADREATTRAIGRLEEVVRTTAEARDGHVFAGRGDSIGVAFHRVDDAARWAIDTQRAVAGEAWPDEAAIGIRVGLHTGDAEERDGSYFGPAVNIAARLATAGHRHQTVLSGATAGLIGAVDLRAGLRDLGPILLDGPTASQPVLQLGPGTHPPLRGGGIRSGNLPKASGPLLGRADVLDAAVAALADTPIVTLVGPGGIGKTRLALAAAELAASDAGHRPWLVELADVTSPDEVVRAVADALDLKQFPNLSLLDSVIAALRARHALLVLDNCEHVIDGAAELAAAVSAAADVGGNSNGNGIGNGIGNGNGNGNGNDNDNGNGNGNVRILATSREGLGVAAEQLVVVGPLAVESGVALFDLRASAVDRSYDAEANRPVVAEICRRLDGVPLAIELAAARVRSLAPADLVRRLDDSFRVLAGGRRRSVARHRTLRATIQWSHDLLTPAEQVLFRRLSIFAGTFDLDAAEQVVADEWLPVEDVDGVLGDLVERSMVLVESGGHGRRFRLLETMRQFGAERLAGDDDADRLARRHADYVVGEVGRIATLLNGWGEVDGAGRLAELWPNLRAAFDWAEAGQQVDLAVALLNPIADLSFARRGLGELADWAIRILELADPDDDETIARALMWLAFHHGMSYDREAQIEIESRYGAPDHVLVTIGGAGCLDLHGEILDQAPWARAELEHRGEPHLVALLDILVAGTLLGNGRLDEADEVLSELVERFRTTGPPTFLNWCLYMSGTAADFRGDHDRAEAFYDEAMAVELPKDANSPNEILTARAALRQGHQRLAFTLLRDYADDLLEGRILSGAGLLAIEYVNMMVEAGRLDRAATVLGYVDRSENLDVEGAAFRLLVTDAGELVDADADAAAIRLRTAADDGVGDEWALRTMRTSLDELLAAGN